MHPEEIMALATGSPSIMSDEDVARHRSRLEAQARRAEADLARAENLDRIVAERFTPPDGDAAGPQGRGITLAEVFGERKEPEPPVVEQMPTEDVLPPEDPAGETEGWADPETDQQWYDEPVAEPAPVAETPEPGEKSVVAERVLSPGQSLTITFEQSGRAPVVLRVRAAG